MASTSKSSSKSTTWEGIDGYVGKFVDRDKLNWTPQSTVPQAQIALASGDALAKQYGFLSGDAIDKRYKDATNAKFNELDQTARKARDTSLNDTALGLDSYMSALRQQRANAVQTGITRGANAASDVQALLGQQRQVSDSQQAYADQLTQIGQQRGTAAYQAQIDALGERNNVANQLGALGMQKYGFDVQDQASYYSYLGQQGANQAAMNQAASTWNATEGQNAHRKTSESVSESSSYDNSADIAASAQRYAADRSYAASTQGTAAQSGYYNDQVAAWKAQGYSDSVAKLLAGGADASKFDKPQPTVADLNSSAAVRIPKANTTKKTGTPPVGAAAGQSGNLSSSWR